MRCVVCGLSEGKGKRNICRRCWRKEYEEKNKEKIKKQAQARYLRNRERHIKQSKEWYANHKEESSIYKTKWTKENRDRVNKIRKKYSQNKEVDKVQKIRSRTKHHFGHLRKEGKCGVCNKKRDLEFHHLQPYRYDNFMILCKNCHLNLHGKELVSPFLREVNK